MSDYNAIAGMTWRDLVRAHIPAATDQEADVIFWEHTAFPMADKDYVNRQIAEYAAEAREASE